MKNTNFKTVVLAVLGITTIINAISAIHSHRKIRKLKKKLDEANAFISDSLNHFDCDFCGCLDELEDEEE